MKKKMRKFEEGGLSKAQEEWLGGADRSDPYIMARMRKAVPDEPKAAPKADAGELRDETGEVSKIRRNTETGDLYSTEAPTPKAAPKAETKAAPKAETKMEKKAGEFLEKEKAPAKKTTVQELRESLKKRPEMPGPYKKESVGTEKPKADLSGLKFGNIAKKLREKAGITSYKSGGSVKSSASRRADGCAVRGKTKGRIV